MDMLRPCSYTVPHKAVAKVRGRFRKKFRGLDSCRVKTLPWPISQRNDKTLDSFPYVITHIVSTNALRTGHCQEASHVASLSKTTVATYTMLHLFTDKPPQTSILPLHHKLPIHRPPTKTPLNKRSLHLQHAGSLARLTCHDRLHPPPAGHPSPSAREEPDV